MNATTFDSLSVARKLKAAGMEEKQAETIAEVMHETIAAPRQRLLTKSDLAVVKSDLDAFEMGLKAEIKANLTFVVNRMTFTMLVAMGVLFAALKLV